MAKLSKYDLTGKEAGEVSIDDKLLGQQAHSQLIKDYLVAIRKNARQWSANTQTRAEVSHSKKKPHPQKGTGNARQGFLGSPQFRGGGRVFAPRPKFDQHVRINRKERRKAVGSLLAERISSGHAFVLNNVDFSSPKTKSVQNFLNAIKVSGKRVLFLFDSTSEKTEKNYDFFIKSLRNIPKVQFGFLRDANGYELAVSSEVVFLEPAIDELKILLGGNE